MFLITTADQRFWKKDKEVLFLGEWCKLFSEKEKWSQLNYVMLPYHWDDRKKFNMDFQFMESVYEKYLVVFSERLNQIHNVNYSVRYWRIIIGVWLRAFIDSLYDRFLSITYAKESGLVSNTWICSTESWTPSEYPSFSHDGYNLYLYSRIIKFVGGIAYEEKNMSHNSNGSEFPVRHKSKLVRVFSEIVRQLTKGPKLFLQQGFAVLFIELYPRILRRIKLKVAFAGSIYLSLANQLRLQLSLGQLPVLYHGEKILLEPKLVDKNMRSKLTFPKSDELFEKLLNEMLPDQTPMLYVEDFQDVHKRVMKNSPKAPDVIITAFTINYRRCYEFWAAYHSEVNGTKLVLSQHGGGYGIARQLSLDSHFVRCFDRYYTWGSTLNGESNVKPMPSLRLHTTSKKLNTSNKKGSIMWVATTMARYKTFAEDGLAGPHMLLYFEEQRSFYDALSNNVQKLLLWRYFNDPWEDLDRMKEFAPNLNIQCGLKKQLGKESDFISELKKCRLAIHTANETTYLETLSANFPTLIYWNPIYYAVKESLQPVFNELKNAGILHYTPESAAAKLNEIYSDPSEWWESQEVQSARIVFCDALANTSDNWLVVWEEELKKQIHA